MPVDFEQLGAAVNWFQQRSQAEDAADSQQNNTGLAPGVEPSPAEPMAAAEIPTQPAFDPDAFLEGIRQNPITPGLAEFEQSVNQEKERTFRENIAEEYSRGSKAFDLDLAAAGIADNPTDEAITEHMQLRNSYDQMRQQDPIQADNIVEKALFGAAEILPGMVRGFGRGAIGAGIGAGLGFGIGTLVNPAPGPEDVALSASLGRLGLKWGAQAGSGALFYKQGKGQFFADMINEGMDKDTASIAAKLGALPYAGVEMLQLGGLLPPIKLLGGKVASETAKEVTKKTIIGFIKKLGFEYVKTVLSESAEEGAQQMVQDLTTQIANNLSKSDLQLSSQGRLFIRAFSAFTQSLLPMAVLGLPGAVGTAATELRSNAAPTTDAQVQGEGADVTNPQPTVRVQSQDSIGAVENLRGKSIIPDDVIATPMLTQEMSDLWDIVNGLTGKNIVFVDNLNVNGLVDPEQPGILFVSSKAESTLMNAAMHEVTEGIFLESPADGQALLEILSETGSQNFEDWASEMQGNAAQAGLKPMSDERLRQEFVANFIGEQATEEKFWDNLYDRSPTTFAKVVKWVRDFLANMGNRLGVGAYSVKSVFKDNESMERALSVATGVLNKRAQELQGFAIGKQENAAVAATEALVPVPKAETQGKPAEAAQKPVEKPTAPLLEVLPEPVAETEKPAPITEKPVETTELRNLAKKMAMGEKVLSNAEVKLRDENKKELAKLVKEETRARNIRKAEKAAAEAKKTKPAGKEEASKTAPKPQPKRETASSKGIKVGDKAVARKTANNKKRHTVKVVQVVDEQTIRVQFYNETGTRDLPIEQVEKTGLAMSLDRRKAQMGQFTPEKQKDIRTKAKQFDDDLRASPFYDPIDVEMAGLSQADETRAKYDALKIGRQRLMDVMGITDKDPNDIVERAALAGKVRTWLKKAKKHQVAIEMLNNEIYHYNKGRRVSINEAYIDDDSLVYREGQWFRAKNRDGGTRLIDGKEILIDDFGTIDGVLVPPGSDEYLVALNDYDQQEHFSEKKTETIDDFKARHGITEPKQGEIFGEGAVGDSFILIAEEGLDGAAAVKKQEELEKRQEAFDKAQQGLRFSLQSNAKQLRSTWQALKVRVLRHFAAMGTALATDPVAYRALMDAWLEKAASGDIAIAELTRLLKGTPIKKMEDSIALTKALEMKGNTGRPGLRADLRPIFDILFQYREEITQQQKDVGLNVNFPASAIAGLNAELGKLDPAKDAVRVNEIKSLIATLENMAYVGHNIVASRVIEDKLMKAGRQGQKDLQKKLEEFHRMRKGKTAWSLQDYVDAGIIAQEDMEVVNLWTNMAADAYVRIAHKHAIDFGKANKWIIPSFTKNIPDDYVFADEDPILKRVPALKNMRLHPMYAEGLRQLAGGEEMFRNPWMKLLTLTKIGQFFKPGIIWSYNVYQAIMGGSATINPARLYRNTKKAWVMQKMNDPLVLKMERLGLFQSPCLPTKSSTQEKIDMFARSMRDDIFTSEWMERTRRIYERYTGTRLSPVAVKDMLAAWKKDPVAAARALPSEMLEALLLPYRATSVLTWDGDRVQRIISVLNLIDMNVPFDEAVREATQIHGAYPSIGPGYKKWASAIFFVHTFRLLMPIRTVKGAFGFPTYWIRAAMSKFQGKNFVRMPKWKEDMMARQFIGTISIPLAVHAMMTASGWKPVESDDDDDKTYYDRIAKGVFKNNWKYSKTFNWKGKDREVVMGVNTIVNMWTKWSDRLIHGKRLDLIDNQFSGFSALMKWEINPFYRIVMDLVDNESSFGGLPPRDLKKDMNGQFMDSVGYVFKNMFRLYGEGLAAVGKGNEDTGWREDKRKQQLNEALDATDQAILLVSGYAYTRSSKRDRAKFMVQRLKSEVAKAKAVARRHYKGQRLKDEEKYLDKIEKERVKKIKTTFGFGK